MLGLRIDKSPIGLYTAKVGIFCVKADDKDLQRNTGGYKNVISCE